MQYTYSAICHVKFCKFIRECVWTTYVSRFKSKYSLDILQNRIWTYEIGPIAKRFISKVNVIDCWTLYEVENNGVKWNLEHCDFELFGGKSTWNIWGWAPFNAWLLNVCLMSEVKLWKNYNRYVDTWYY